MMQTAVLKGCGILVLTFCFGLCTGLGGGYWFLRWRISVSIHDPQKQAGLGTYYADRLTARFTRELKLDENERARVREELQKAAERYRGVRTRAMENTESLLRETFTQIESELPSDKQREFHHQTEEVMKELGMSLQ